MAFSGIILSNVIDITSYTPSEQEKFLIDTNVLFWMTYSKGIPPNQLYLHDYNTFINATLANGSLLFHSGLSLAELAHIIEKTEREIHESVIGRKIKTKEFRNDYSNERNDAIKEIQAAWMQVENLASQIELTICPAITSSCISNMPLNTLDGYDLMIHKSMSDSEILNIITHDADYTSVPGINVFTINRNVILAAGNQGKLLP